VSKVRWGLLVTGGYADVAMMANASSETTGFVAVCAGDAEQSKAYAEARGIPASHASYDELLAAEDVDAVFVALHPVDHAEWAIKALQAGKHVLVEKPLALTAADAERVFDAAEAAGRQVVEGVMFRHHPQTLLAQRLVDEGRIGELRYIYGSCTATLPPDYFRRDRSLGGGALLDLGVFPLTAIRMFGGSPQRVYAEEVRRDGGADLNYSAVLRLPGDVLAQFEAGQEVARGDALHIVGTLGRVIVPDPWLGRAEKVELSLQGPPPHGDPVSEFFEVDPDGSLGAGKPFAVSRLQFDAVSAAFAGGDPLPFGRADAVEQARVLEALLESSGEARAVEITG
jgi:predicted dehydrogenase